MDRHLLGLAATNIPAPLQSQPISNSSIYLMIDLIDCLVAIARRYNQDGGIRVPAVRPFKNYPIIIILLKCLK